MKNYLILFIIMLLLLSGCKSEFFVADNFPWIQDTHVLFKDDFSQVSGGWITHEDRLSFSGYESDGFRLWTDVPNYQVWSVPGLNFKNTFITVRATKLAGPDNNIFGLLCRYQNEENFYALLIGSDGYYGIIKNVEGVQSLVDQPFMEFSEVIQRGDSSNSILAGCYEDQLILVVNDVKLLEVKDKSLTHGDVGLIAGNFAEPGVDILFDDFYVITP